MEFNALVKAQLFPILRKYGFAIAEEFKNIVRFRSSVVKINIVFNPYEQSYLVEIGNPGEILYPLNNGVAGKLFNDELPIEQITPEVFVKNLSLLFETKEGVEILKGNLVYLKRIVKQQSEDYTSDLVRRQVLEAASKAWDANDYVSFVDNIDKLTTSELPQSYRLKYKIAIQKL
jgi:hypothetical protein